MTRVTPGFPPWLRSPPRSPCSPPPRASLSHPPNPRGISSCLPLTIEAAAARPQRFRPDGDYGTGGRTPDPSRSRSAWTPRPPAGRHGRTGQDAGSSGRSIRRLLTAARSDSLQFLHSSSRPALRAASGRPPARPRHLGHRGTGPTLRTRRGRRLRGLPRLKWPDDEAPDPPAGSPSKASGAEADPGHAGPQLGSERLERLGHKGSHDHQVSRPAASFADLH
jgi:hypothetical protein